jgi:hypothetical protein
MILLVTYNLKRPAISYRDFFGILKGQNSWWHYLPSTWLVDTDLSSRDLYRELKPFLQVGDHILVTELSRDRQGWLPKKAWEWIRRHEPEIP